MDWFDSSTLNDNQVERNFYNVVALTHSSGDIDAQLSYFSRYSTVHFVPDQVGDLVFNGVASNVYRSGLVNGLQGDGAYRIGDGHTCAQGSSSAGRRRIWSTPQSSCRSTTMAIRSMRRSAYTTPIPSSVGSPASTRRMNGKSPID